MLSISEFAAFPRVITARVARMYRFWLVIVWCYLSLQVFVVQQAVVW